MPRNLEISKAVAGMSGSLFSALAHRLASYEGEVFPLHIGDTWMEPAPGCRMQDLTVEEFPGMHRYASPHGLPELLDAVIDRTLERTGVPTTRGDVLVSAGATGGLGAAVGATVDAGDEVLLLSPYWPLIAGILRSICAVPVPVPLFGDVDSSEAAVAALEASFGERTVGLYVNTPNNPTGGIIPADWLDAMVAWARAHDLWIFTDEVYEDYAYRGEHVCVRSLAPERTFSVHSFSKAFGMAGNRCGYVIGPSDVMGHVRKVSTHSFYSTPTAAQIAAARALRGAADEWIANAREQYRKIGDAAAARLGVAPPEGGQFLWMDVQEHLDERGLLGFLEDCAVRGLFLAPGESFGPYPSHIRVCFTCSAPDVVERGVDLLARILGR